MVEPPSLSELAIQQCIRYASFIVDIGELPYAVVKPFLAKLDHEHLALIENQSPHIVAESDELWRDALIREFRDRKVPATNFRKTFYQYRRDKEEQLGAARERLKRNQEQFNKNKRAASVVALSEEELPISQRSSASQAAFKSRTMQSVARRAQANFQSRKPPLAFVPPKLVKADYKHPDLRSHVRTPDLPKSTYPPAYSLSAYSSRQPQLPSQSQLPSQVYQRQQSPPPPGSNWHQPGAGSSLGSPPMSPPSSSSNRSPLSPSIPPGRPASGPPPKRKRLSSVFMPKR